KGGLGAAPACRCTKPSVFQDNLLNNQSSEISRKIFHQKTRAILTSPGLSLRNKGVELFNPGRFATFANRSRESCQTRTQQNHSCGFRNPGWGRGIGLSNIAAAAGIYILKA